MKLTHIKQNYCRYKNGALQYSRSRSFKVIEIGTSMRFPFFHCDMCLSSIISYANFQTRCLATWHTGVAHRCSYLCFSASVYLFIFVFPISVHCRLLVSMYKILGDQLIDLT